MKGLNDCYITCLTVLATVSIVARSTVTTIELQCPAIQAKPVARPRLMKWDAAAATFGGINDPPSARLHTVRATAARAVGPGGPRGNHAVGFSARAPPSASFTVSSHLLRVQGQQNDHN